MSSVSFKVADPLARWTLVKNAVANIASGASGAILAVVLPPILVRYLEQDTYSTWVLILQVGAYVDLLNFGLQTAVGRFVAREHEGEDHRQRDRIVSTATAILCGAVILGWLLIVFVIWKFSFFFPKVPTALYPQARTALAWVGGSMALGLPFTVFSGIFIGLQRNEVPAAIHLTSRLLIGMGIVIAVLARGDLVVIAKTFASVNLITYAVQAFVGVRFGGSLRLSAACVDRSAFRILLNFCTALTVWSFALLLVSGLDLLLVAWLDFPMVGAFGIAAGLLSLLTGFQSAIFQVLMPASAVLEGRGDQAALGQVLLRGTRLNIALLTLLSAFCVAIVPSMIGLYIGPFYEIWVMRFFDILLLGTIIRLSMIPFVFVVIGTGDHHKIMGGPLAEGFSNLVASVLLGMAFGAVGVAWGTVLGGLVGVAAHLWVYLPRCSRFRVDTSVFLRRGILIPGSALLPLVAARAMSWGLLANNPQLDTGIRVASMVMSLTLLWRVGLNQEERLFFKSYAKWRA